MSSFRLIFPTIVSILVSELPGQSISEKKTYPTFPIGPTGIHASIEPGFQVTVQSITQGSPAEGLALKKGDILTSIGGQILEGPDPRIALGDAIGRAEAEDGALLLEYQRNNTVEKASIKLPLVEAYRLSWPENCPKSHTIIAANAKHIASALQNDGSYKLPNLQIGSTDLKACLAGLFLLSTGDDVYLPKVAKQAQALAILAESRRNAGGHINWQLGYQGIFLGEYYLRTGDKSVLKGLKEICDWTSEGQAAGGWGHGANPGPGYVQSGLLNHTTVPILTALILARECGVDFDEAAYTRAVKLMYRMAGHGCVPYGDHRAELWWSNTNGRNAMLACAFSLLDEPRFQRASEHLALLVADSYHQPEFGHTGGGFNVIWRGMASIHIPEKRKHHYQRQMKNLAWYYDLSRLPGGGFSMLATPPDNGRYSGREWGVSIGLTYTAPLAKLRITGAPKSKFSVKTKPVNFSWGSEADLIFLSTDDAKDFGKEESPPHEIYNQLLGEKRNEVSPEFCTKYLRHFSPLVRTWAARRLKEMKVVAPLEEAVLHSDPRVRRAVYDAISGYDNWRRPFKTTLSPEIVSAKFLPAILKTLNNPRSSWWECDGALFALGCAKPDDIRANLSLILKFSKHEEWYLREAAFWAIVGLRDTITGEEFNHLSDIYGASRHVFARSSYDAGFRAILKSSKAKIDKISINQAAKTLGKTTHQPSVMPGYGTGGIHEATHRTMMVLKHFDPSIYELMIEDFVQYLDLWEPYYQHSVWLITGSKWQPGIPKVLQGLGAEGKPIVRALKRIQERFDSFDQKRVGKAGQDLEIQIQKAIEDWEKEQKSP
ncbi:MAG: DUF6288 domain-containing protein [Akkermansiaceae bacterium]